MDYTAFTKNQSYQNSPSVLTFGQTKWVKFSSFNKTEFLELINKFDHVKAKIKPKEGKYNHYFSEKVRRK